MPLDDNKSKHFKLDDQVALAAKSNEYHEMITDKAERLIPYYRMWPREGGFDGVACVCNCLLCPMHWTNQVRCWFSLARIAGCSLQQVVDHAQVRKVLANL